MLEVQAEDSWEVWSSPSWGEEIGETWVLANLKLLVVMKEDSFYNNLKGQKIKDGVAIWFSWIKVSCWTSPDPVIIWSKKNFLSGKRRNSQPTHTDLTKQDRPKTMIMHYKGYYEVVDTTKTCNNNQKIILLWQQNNKYGLWRKN